MREALCSTQIVANSRVLSHILVAQLVKNPPAMQETLVRLPVTKIPWRRDRLPTPVFLGFPGGLDSKELPAMRETWVWSLGWEDPLGEGMAIHSVFLPGESHGQRSLIDCSPWGHRESNTTEWLTHVAQTIPEHAVSAAHSVLQVSVWAQDFTEDVW